MFLNPKVLRAGGLVALLALLPVTAAVSVEEMESTDLLQVVAPFSEPDAQGRNVYLIRFAEAGLVERFRASRSVGERFDPQSSAMRAATAELQQLQSGHLQVMRGLLGRELAPSHRYLATHSGMAVRLTAEEAKKIAGAPGVVEVERERVYALDTSRTPEFIGADTLWDGTNVPGGDTLLGQGMVAGILDTGIVVNHPSYANDVAVCGHGQGGVPDKLLSAVDCSTTDGSGRCNGPNPGDTNGHGSHTAGTTAGGFVGLDATPAPPAPLAGVAPCAHIRAYKVCSTSSCGSADIQAGMNTLLLDGDVDAMNFSISGGTSPWTDADRRKLDLVDAGIFVAASAGNTRTETPNPIGAVNHRGPWVMTVANSTHDRVLSNLVNVSLGGPQNVHGVKGGMPIPADVTGEVADSLALGNELGCTAGGGFPAGSMTGKIALIVRGSCNFSEKLANAQAAGAIGGIIVNSNPGQPPIVMGSTETSIPAVMVFNAPGLAIRQHVTTNPTALATIAALTTESFDPAVGDILNAGSLRGPTPAPLRDLQKPDITGPGTDVIAAGATPAGEPTYATLSGTSMSSPHIAGSALLVRQKHPSWTAPEVKSALQMTSKRTGLKDFVNGTPNTGPWDADDVGHGRVDLTKAARAGLVMHETTANFLASDPASSGDVRTLNLPAIRHLDCSPSCSFTRTVRNTLGTATSWTAASSMVSGNFNIQVSPSTFAFTGNTSETRTLTITITPNGNQSTQTHFGAITFTEAGSQSPQLHWTLALRGVELGPAELDVTPGELDLLVVSGGSRTVPLTISNTNATGEALTFSFAEAPANAVVLDINDKQDDRAGGPAEPISLQVDTGIAALIGVADQQWLWFNRFSPTQLQVPFDLQRVEVGFAPGNANVQTGDLFDVHVWVDADRDPTNGATLVASVTGQVITAGVGFKVVNLPTPVAITASSGDVLIGVVNRSARILTGTSYGVAVRDTAGNSQQRSWLAFNFPGGIAANPPVFADAADFDTLDGLGVSANLAIRGFGTGGTNCLAPSDVPWLSVNPTSGSINGGASATVQVTVDSTGLANGTYEALLCLTSNDPDEALTVLPVRMQVVNNEDLPNIAVTPASLSLQAPVGGAQIDNISISNSGALLPLNWSILEADGVTGRGGDIVSFDDINFSFPADFDGGSVKWVDGETCSGCFSPPFDLNVYIGTNMQFFWPNVAGGAAGGGVMNGATYAVLQPGAEIGPSSTLGATTASAATIGFRQAGGVDGYLGFAFVNPNTMQLNYGYARLQTTGTTGFPVTLVSFAYDRTGAPITIPLPSACDSPSDVDWLSVDSASGSTAAGASSTVAVTADATGLVEDTYEATVCVQSNDADSPVVEVPVTFTVQPQTPDIFADGFED
jgi:subtilisin family serine protease